VREADNLTTFMCRMSWKSGSLKLLRPSGPHLDCFETPLPSFSYYLETKHNRSDVMVNSLNFLMSSHKHSVLRSDMDSALQPHNAPLCRISFVSRIIPQMAGYMRVHLVCNCVTKWRLPATRVSFVS